MPIPTDGTRPALTFSDRLYYCAQDDAPDFRWRSPEAVRPICTITSNLSGVPVSKFKRQNNNKGVEFYRVSFVLRLSVEREVGCPVAAAAVVVVVVVVASTGDTADGGTGDEVRDAVRRRQLWTGYGQVRRAVSGGRWAVMAGSQCGVCRQIGAQA